MTKYWFVYCKDALLLEVSPDGSATIPTGDTPPTEVKPWTCIHNVTPLPDGEVKTYRIDTPVTDRHGYEMCGLRQSYGRLPLSLYEKAGQCAEILYWDANTQYCGVCGGEMRLSTDISKKCSQCGKEVWPQLATAVICLIHRGEEVLLVHARNFRRKEMYGLVAGFVETGETLEEAVRREVLEETGLTIGVPQYFGSQPWPYPCGLMVGFTAEYAGGEIRLQRSELSRGGWYRWDHLPPIPEKLSIARKLIDHWLQRFGTP